MPISMGSGRHGQIHLSSTIGAHNGGDKLRIGCAEADQPLTNLAKQTADRFTDMLGCNSSLHCASQRSVKSTIRPPDRNGMFRRFRTICRGVVCAWLNACKKYLFGPPRHALPRQRCLLSRVRRMTQTRRL